jgi:ABC-type dipeptide/oligopeptide/nickel transport system permease subunit
MLEVLGQDYIRTLRAKGLNEKLVVWQHALKNSLISVITIFALELGWIFAGAVAVEVVFGWPGAGRMLVDAVARRDFPIVQALTLVLSAGVIGIDMTKRTEINPDIETSSSLMEEGGEENIRSNTIRLLMQNKIVMISGVIVLIFILIGLIGPILTPYGYADQDLINSFAPPLSPGHLLGTDNLGRDLLTRIVYGVRISLYVSIIVTVLSLILGMVIGIIAGYFGGRMDFVLSSLMDIAWGFPLLALASKPF